MQRPSGETDAFASALRRPGIGPSSGREVNQVFQILVKKSLGENVTLYEVEAPRVARRHRAGQFVMVRPTELRTHSPDHRGHRQGEGDDHARGPGRRKDHFEMSEAFDEGDSFANVAGPLGNPTHIAVPGKAGGFSRDRRLRRRRDRRRADAPHRPRLQGGRARGRDDPRRAAQGPARLRGPPRRRLERASRLHGRRLVRPQGLRDRCLEGPDRTPARGGGDVHLAIAIGPPIMMKFCSKTTQPYAVPTLVSLNTIMVDGTGMCGGCRVMVDGVAKYVCVDGPEFDGHHVDFDGMMRRQAMYKPEEAASLERYRENDPRADAGLRARRLGGRSLMSDEKRSEPDPGGARGAHRESREPDEQAARPAPEGLLGGAGAGRARQEHPRGAVRLHAGPGARRGPALPLVQERAVRLGLPRRRGRPAFLRLVAEGDFRGAIRTIKETNLLPAICGRVCPQESQCQENCMVAKVHKDLGFAVSVGKIEAFLADWEREVGGVELPAVGAPSGFRVAIIGAGPSGLTCAGDLRRFGHEAVVFEAFHKAGGVLVYGIPEFRLPKDIVQAEVDNLAKMGVQFEFDTVVGQTLSVDDLFDEGFHAVYVATGAGLPYFVNVPGEDLNGVYSANEYLTRANLMGAYRFPEEDTPVLRRDNVAVLGGGNVAMDAARTALRLGAKNVYLVYRRSRVEMPARVEEVHHAEEEGVQFRMLYAPVEILATPDGWVRGLKVQRCELGEPTRRAAAAPSRSRAPTKSSPSRSSSRRSATAPIP